ncbi:hypothetical protein JXA84_03315 [candidate division WOR-3 bacterium]|nr:hypothetical protein [candidate division WOR-3 bacterium]
MIRIKPRIGYERYLIKTDLITDMCPMEKVIERYVARHLKSGDCLVIAESVLAITQGRAIPVDKIKVGIFAKVLWRFVGKVPYGVGLRSPTSMQCAIDEAGILKILSAAIAGGLTKPFGKKGMFYKVAGKQAATIDAAFTSPVEPYHRTVIKGPHDPEGNAGLFSEIFKIEVAIMDINDIGGSWVIGASTGVDRERLSLAMLDNPMGQGAQMTPFCILREIN